MTGTLNRTALDEELTRELRRVERTGAPLSVLMIDVDHFKRFNDRYGHVVGDEALRAVADKLAALLRSTDRIGRYGGDELLVLLPDTDREAAATLSARIRLAWKRHPPIASGTSEPVLISVGAATTSRPISAESLIKTADVRMYDAKRERRW